MSTASESIWPIASRSSAHRLEDLENLGVKGLRINNNLPDRTVFMNAWARLSIDS